MFTLFVWECVFQAQKSTKDGLDKDVGKLLYHIATKLKTQIKQHQAKLVEYVATRKIKSENQLNGKYLFLC